MDMEQERHDAINKLKVWLSLKETRPGVQTNGDATQLCSCTKALIRTNLEIWLRCEEKLCSSPTDDCPLFTRYGYSTVAAQGDGMQLLFIARDVSESKEFAHLPTIPTEILDIVPIPCFLEKWKDQGNVIRDYENIEKYFCLLHDDVLVPFLQVLMVHLSEVQVSLGAIESWLMEPEVSRVFLADTFNISLPFYPSDAVILESIWLSSNLTCEKFFQVGTLAGQRSLTRFRNYILEEEQDTGEHSSTL